MITLNYYYIVVSIIFGVIIFQIDIMNSYVYSWKNLVCMVLYMFVDVCIVYVYLLIYIYSYIIHISLYKYIATYITVLTLTYPSSSIVGIDIIGHRLGSLSRHLHLHMILVPIHL